jgi:predicted RNA-binding protein with PIN domain
VTLDDQTWLLVDGNNVMGAAADGWWRDPPAAVRRLLARLQCYANKTTARVELVLDVRQPDLPEGDHDGIVVRYATRRGRDAADDRIVELIGDDLPADNQDVEVVTSDRGLRERVLRRGARVTGAGAFLTRLSDAGC